MIRLESVNIGTLAPLSASASRRTGIHKHPVGGPVLCDAMGLVGDAVGNAKHHGGRDQALYVYSAHDYAWWTITLGRPCGPGLFGDNLTIDRWWQSPRVGDRVQFGDVLLELTAPRIPCATLAGRMGVPTFVKQFADAARPGAYARVVQPGAIEAGVSGIVTRSDERWPTIDALFGIWYQTPRTPAVLIDALRAPVAERVRERFLGWVHSGR
jgi:MOSC domain-containing protein YiiM